MPDFERVLDDLEIDLEKDPIKKSYKIVYKAGKRHARIEIALIAALIYFAISAIGYYTYQQTEKKIMKEEWIEVKSEKTRKMVFKNDPVPLLLTNVTAIKKRMNGYMLKCNQGVVYFATDNVSYIVSDCEDWVV